MSLYAEVIVDNKAVETDRPFIYKVPPELKEEIQEGMRVIIPFGRGNSTIKGMVIALTSSYNGSFKLKNIIDVLDERPLINRDLISLSKWMKDTYLSSYLDCIKLVLPPGDFKEIESLVSLREDVDLDPASDEAKIVEILRVCDNISLEDLKSRLKINNLNNKLINLQELSVINIDINVKTKVNKKYEKYVYLEESKLSLEEKLELVGNRAKKQILVLKYMEKYKKLSLKELLMKAETTKSTVDQLKKKGLIAYMDLEVNREAIRREIVDYEKIRLNEEQRNCLDTIIENKNLEFGAREFLIHGVTGSGKTEIYLQLVEEMLREGKDSIILVPEIALTPQTIDRFVGRFREAVAVLHSGLSAGERFDQWRLIREGKVKIVVGARSAVFAPFSNLGLIVIDEEHEDTYKSSQNPKYNTYDVARERIKESGGLLIMGTATPSVDLYHSCQTGEVRLLELKKRANKKLAPKTELVDMRQELNNGNLSMFSLPLYSALKENLDKGKQSILFLNRRGYSSFISCRECGHVLKCEECDVSMTYHRGSNRVKCHYCGRTKAYPRACPECGSRYIKHFGVGTEQVETLTKNLFKDARIARMDGDTMTEKGRYESVLEDMKNGKIDILIGTQMISKGLDFENVTLVGIIAADTTLNLPDYRSAEKGFQLITQVSGRAGRGRHEGRVILQTYDPDHYSIGYAKEGNYTGFYNEEIQIRKEFLYPPFINLISILVYGEEYIKVQNTTEVIYNRLLVSMDWVDKKESYKYIIGPYPAPIEKIRRNYRFQIILKIENSNMHKIREILNRELIENMANYREENVKVSIDINPKSIL